jgi:hypothetical protein
VFVPWHPCILKVGRNKFILSHDGRRLESV